MLHVLHHKLPVGLRSMKAFKWLCKLRLVRQKLHQTCGYRVWPQLCLIWVCGFWDRLHFCLGFGFFIFKTCKFDWLHIVLSNSENPKFIRLILPYFPQFIPCVQKEAIHCEISPLETNISKPWFFLFLCLRTQLDYQLFFHLKKSSLILSTI